MIALVSESAEEIVCWNLEVQEVSQDHRRGSVGAEVGLLASTYHVDWDMTSYKLVSNGNCFVKQFTGSKTDHDLFMSFPRIPSSLLHTFGPVTVWIFTSSSDSDELTVTSKALVRVGLQV